MIRFLMALTLVLLTSPALAQSCSCDIAIPVPGQYRITGPDFTDVVTLEVGTGENGSCGGGVTITSAPGVHFTCEGTLYRGIIPGNAEGRPPQEMVLIPNQAIPGSGYTITTSFGGIIQRPGLISFVPGEHPTPSFSMELLSATSTKAPACMCKSVKGWIDTSRQVQALYSDQSLIDDAINNKVAGIDPDDAAWPNGDLIGGYNPISIYTSYQERITSRINSADFFHDETSENDVVANSAAATTDPSSCYITNASPTSDSGQCRPGIVLSAIRAHEEVHANRCLALFDKDEDATAYSRWSNHPPNHALDEREAYQVVLDMLESWYAESCS